MRIAHQPNRHARHPGRPPGHAAAITLKSPSKEGYTLSVAPGGVSIRARTSQGLFYGVQSLLQLIPADGDKHLPALEISDEPRFGWRGLLLDVSRHFFTIGEVKRMIDEMVVYKFNLLHLHLSDDQGWRVEIKSLPELTATGAWRVPRTGLWWDRQSPEEGEKATYGGFYPQEQIKDLVQYAAQRHVDLFNPAKTRQETDGLG